MSAPNGQSSSVGTEADDYGETYFRSHCGADEPYEWDSPHWRTFFTMVADRIRAVTNPSSVLDVGCARGLLVQAFWEQGVDAYGIDVSEHAIETAHPDVVSRLSVGSADKVAGPWDLITCIEVLEHLTPAEGELAIDAMCAASDRVLISSTPSDFTEPTHVNVREPAAWAASFAERGFFRRIDVDLSFFDSLGGVVRASRRDPARSRVSVRALRLPDACRSPKETCGTAGCSPKDQRARSCCLRISRAREHLRGRSPDLSLGEAMELRHKLLTSRDHAIGAEAEAAQWRLALRGGRGRAR